MWLELVLVVDLVSNNPRFHSMDSERHMLQGCRVEVEVEVEWLVEERLLIMVGWK